MFSVVLVMVEINLSAPALTHFPEKLVFLMCAVHYVVHTSVEIMIIKL
jgi:hypothetical protein